MTLTRNRKYTRKERDHLPDSAFLLPKYRKLPFKQMQGGSLKVSLSHVRNALARANQVEGVPRRELEAAVRRARMILASRGGYSRSAPAEIRLAANAGGLTRLEAGDVRAALLKLGVPSTDIEIVPLTRSSLRLCVLFWDGYEWAEILSKEDAGEIMKYKANRASGRASALTRREADDLAKELRGDFPEARTVPKGVGYAVEVLDSSGYGNTITSVSDLRFVANRAPSRRPMVTYLSKSEADRLADDLAGDFEGVRTIRKGAGYAVELLDGSGYPVTICSVEDLRMVANPPISPSQRRKLPKPPSKKEPLKMKSWQDLIHEAERDKYPFDFAVRNPREDAALTELVCEGLVEGFWVQAWMAEEEEEDRYPGEGQAPDAPEEVREFVATFYAATKRLNGFSLGEFFSDMQDTSDPELFGYYIAMQSVGHGVSWWDDKRPMRRGSRFKQLRLPHSEVHVDYMSMDPTRLNFVAWKA